MYISCSFAVTQKLIVLTNQIVSCATCRDRGNKAIYGVYVCKVYFDQAYRLYHSGNEALACVRKVDETDPLKSGIIMMPVAYDEGARLLM